ncbi:MAG: TIGR02757 family protein [Crocinitomicaceae bacterium]|nr:TIGR02757 family protein [Crocinitomicaceae bacterium]
MDVLSDSKFLKEVKILLEEKSDQYNTAEFIREDPVSIPHQLCIKEDIEIIAFIVATISWGNRKSIIKNGEKLLDIMGYQPLDFILNASRTDLKSLHFVHRTFNADDLQFFIRAFKKMYAEQGGLESAFGGLKFKGDLKERIIYFREKMLQTKHEKRTEKHISSPLSNSACKRINMFLRWMVRNDKRHVDFGIWKTIKPAELMLPLDVHTGRVARELGILKRTQNDWTALEELMQVLRKFDSTDPVKYDFALFGIGAYEMKDKSLTR